MVNPIAPNGEPTVIWIIEMILIHFIEAARFIIYVETGFETVTNAMIIAQNIFTVEFKIQALNWFAIFLVFVMS